MANATVAQSINRQTAAAALRQARIEAAEHHAWITAINRAALNLEACLWAFDGEVLRIASASTNTATPSTSTAASARQPKRAARAGIALRGDCCGRRPSWCRRRHVRSSPRPS